MTGDSQQDDKRLGSKPRVRHTPEHARQERRRAFQAGLVGVVMGLVILGIGVDSMRTGEWVHFGRVGTSLILPGWTVTAIALFILLGSSWILWRFARKVDRL